MTGSLAVQDILFRENFYVVGVLSLLGHGLAISSLYLLLAPCMGRGTALFFAFSFGVQYPGAPLVLWRHISPYLGAPIFFSLGCAVLPSRVSWVLFFLASLFHESVALTLEGLSASHLIFKRIRDPK
jgi:hypothetical protein